jgi:hypothetical protein
MPIDPAGTQPGLVGTSEETKPVHMRCKNPNCDSILAVEIKIPGSAPGVRMYQCVQCKSTRGVNTGGSVDL